MKEIDEIKAEIEKAEKELKEKQSYLNKKKDELESLKMTQELKPGDYIECQINGKRKIALLKLIRFASDGRLAEIEVNTFGNSEFNVSNFKKWQPQKGDLCIFWDKYSKNKAIISVYLLNTADSKFPYRANNTTYTDCIPFISEQQYKEHIGYGKEPTKEQSSVIDTNIRSVGDLLNDYLKHTCKVPLFPVESKISFLSNHFAYFTGTGVFVPSTLNHIKHFHIGEVSKEKEK